MFKIVSLRNIRFESILGISGIICLIGSFAPWEITGATPFNALGTLHGKLVFIGAWFIIFAALAKFSFLKELQFYRPYSRVFLGGIGSLLVLLGALSFPFDMTKGAALGWGFYLSAAFGIISIFSTILIYIESRKTRTTRGL